MTNIFPPYSEFIRESNLIEWVTDEISFSEAMRAWEYLMAQPKLTIKIVKETHRILMNSQAIADRELGAFRKRKCWVGGREGMTPLLIWQAIKSWIVKMNNKKNTDDQKLHVEYEHIHPFIDGNGRTGRMFMNWQRLNRLGKELLVIRDKEKQAYYDWFKRDKEHWLHTSKLWDILEHRQLKEIK